MNSTRYIPSILLGLTLFFVTTSHAAQPKLTLLFGMNSTDSPIVVGQRFMPALKKMGKDLGKRLDREVIIKLRMFRTYDDTIEAFTKGKVDFGRLGPASYVYPERKIRNFVCWLWTTVKARKHSMV